MAAFLNHILSYVYNMKFKMCSYCNDNTQQDDIHTKNRKCVLQFENDPYATFYAYVYVCVYVDRYYIIVIIVFNMT